MYKELKTSRELDLSFDFKIEKYEHRIVDLRVIAQIRPFLYSKNYFEWFMEDLVHYLEQNGLKKRWDFQQVNVIGVDRLGLNKENLRDFVKHFGSVTAWDIEAIYESNFI